MQCVSNKSINPKLENSILSLWIDLFIFGVFSLLFYKQKRDGTV